MEWKCELGKLSRKCKCKARIFRDLCEPLELQIDYWLTSSKLGDVKNDVGGKKNDSGKLTLKTAFRSLQVAKLQFGEMPAAQFSINYSTKEKKQKSESIYFLLFSSFS